MEGNVMAYAITHPETAVAALDFTREHNPMRGDTTPTFSSALVLRVFTVRMRVFEL